MFRNVSFVIFNYDRCVEHYLFKTLRVIYPEISGEYLASVLNATDFIHPYGVIGRLPWQTGPDPEVGYALGLDGPKMLAAAAGLRTFTEGETDAELRGRIQSAVSEAHTCIFLGFSFQSQNMDLLSIPSKGNNKRILGTAYKISDDDIEVCKNRTYNALKLPGTRSLELRSDLTCFALFRAYSQSIAA